MSNWIGKSALNRDMGQRDVGELDAAWVDAFVLAVDDDGRFAGVDGVPQAVPSPGRRRDEDILLGAFQGRTWFARRAGADGPDGGHTWRDVDARWQEPVAAAVALVRWHAMAPHCEWCGGSTGPDGGGVRRICGTCERVAFPRHDPAVIVAVLDPSDRLLLASQRVWAAGRVSVIAGFVEAGESLEQACWREVAEEVGVTLDAVAYVSSQPWPMPRSLMLGFVATTRDETVVPDGHEIEWGKFWTRSEAQEALESGEISLPGTGSIGRALVDSWMAGTLGRPERSITNV